MDVETLWNSFLTDIKENISSLSYETWFRDTKLVSILNNVATIIVPMPFHKKHLIDNYKDVMEEKFLELTGSNFTFNFLLQDEWDSIKSDFLPKTEDVSLKKVTTTHLQLGNNLKTNGRINLTVMRNHNSFFYLFVYKLRQKVYNKTIKRFIVFRSKIWMQN